MGHAFTQSSPIDRTHRVSLFHSWAHGFRYYFEITRIEDEAILKLVDKVRMAFETKPIL